MTGELQGGGPYRETTLAASAAPPRGFFVREDDGELVIEQRWRPDASWWALGAAAAALGGWMAYTFGPAFLVVGGLSLLARCAATSWWFRTTLTLHRRDCTVEQRGLLAKRRLGGPLASLELLGPVRVDSGAKKGDAIHAIEVTLRGDAATIFRGVPEADLQWVMTKIASWKLELAAKVGLA